MLPIHEGEVSGLRIDISLENPITGETKWIDTTAVHTTCLSYQNTELKSIAKRDVSSALTELHCLPNVLEHAPSPTLLRREAEKMVKYGRLLVVAKKQRSEGKRDYLPTFSPFVVSDLDEMAPAAISLQEWLVEQYRRKLVNDGRRLDGCSTADLVRQFRHKFKVGIQLAIAGGLGGMIQAAGQHWGNIGPV